MRPGALNLPKRPFNLDPPFWFSLFTQGQAWIPVLRHREDKFYGNDNNSLT